MKRLFLLLSFVMMGVCAAMAQAPEKMTYQAVVRNSGNSLVANQNVSVRLSILQGSVQGAPVYVENHTAATNDNGLMTVVIGGGAPTTGVFANIDWANGPYFLKSEIDPTGGISYSIESVQQLMSVPYALYAKEAGNGFSGDYNDLTNRPQIPQVPTNVSAFTNDAGYITMDSVPAIPTVPTNVSAFTNDAGYLTSFTESQILSISNDTIYLTGGSFVKLPAGFDGDYNSLTNKPNLAPVATTGSYNDITGKPNLAPVATSGEYNDLTGKPNLAPVATSGNYNDLTNRPQIPQVPTNVSAFQNDAGYITKDSIPAGLAGSQTGDIMYWDAGTNTWIMMPAGTSGQVLTMENGVPRWASLPNYVTMNLPPTVTTTVPSEVTQSSVLCGGEVTSDGSVQLTACGVCWSTHHFPTIADAHTENDLGVSAFTSHVSNLAHHTTYYVRAYATNSVGTSYGAEMTFTTTDIPTDSLMMPNPCSSTDTNTVAQPTLGPNYLVCAGTDSVELSLGNYQYGSIQWQYSLDTISWFDIPNAFDEQLVYKPEQTQFVRAEVSYANCPPEHSEVKLLQKTPAANAGISRTANIGDTLHLQANMEENATGSWQILQGANGLLKTPTAAASKFYGTDSLYRLRWTLTNSCGTSSDDINVRYVRPKVSSKVVVVDTTDIIFSDSAQLAHGYYVISFSDSNIVIGDSTILVSLVNGGFLRRVDSWSMANDSTYAMYTTQASLSDLLESGVINFGGVSNGDNEGGDTVENAVENTPVQDSPDQATPEPDTHTRGVEFLDHIPTRKELREHPEMNGKMYVMGMEFVREDGSRVDLMPQGGTQRGTRGDGDVVLNSGGYGSSGINSDYFNTSGIWFENLNVRVDIPVVEYDRDKHYVKYGFYNAQFIMEGDLVITPSANGLNSSEDIGRTIGYIPTCYYIDDKPIAYTIKCYEKLKLNGTVAVIDTMRHHFNVVNTFTKGVHYDANTNRYIVDSTQNLSFESADIRLVSYDGIGSVNLDVSLELCSDVFCYNQIGPASKVIHKTDINYCSSVTQDNIRDWKGELTSNLFTRLDLNNANIIERNIPSSWSKEFSITSAGRIYPQSIQVGNGDNQTINADGTLSLPISVKVLGSDNRTLANVRVHFLPQDGGSVSEATDTTDQWGEFHIQTIWTPGSLNGNEHKLYAYVYDCNGQSIDNSPIIFTAYEPESQSASCAHSTLQLLIKPRTNSTNNTELMLVPQNGTPPYTYWMDGNNILVNDDYQFHVINMPAEGTHVIGVTDANGCYRVKSFNVGNTRICQLTNLDLDVTTTSGRIELQGVNGNPPYLYARDGNGYSQNNVFTSLSPGTYTVRVMDDRGCQKSRQVEVVVDNSSSQNGRPCAGAATVTDVDNNVYQTLQIGNQCWMKENLRVTKYADGTPLQEGSGFFYPDNNSNNVDEYGLLYTWLTTTGNAESSSNPSGVQGICPNGWHVPSDAEWTQFTDQPQFNCGGGYAKALASNYGWKSSDIPCAPGYQSYRNNYEGRGFNAPPAGSFYNGYSGFKEEAWFWSTTNAAHFGAWARGLKYNEVGLDNSKDTYNGRDCQYCSVYNHYGNYKERANSVRCLRD